MAGLTFEWPLGNRGAQASHRRAQLSRERMAAAVHNLERLVELDVRSACVDVETASEMIVASAATRRLRQETLRAETEKFRVGRSTTFLVSQAQRDLVVSQIVEDEALVGMLKALISLSRLEGTLLSQRGVALSDGGAVGR
jgi:outer membrane protein TolC